MPRAHARVATTRSSIMLADTAIPFPHSAAAANAYSPFVTLASRASSADGSVPVRVSVRLERGDDSLQIIGVAKSVQQGINRRLRHALKAAYFAFPEDHVVVCIERCDSQRAHPLHDTARFDLPIALGLLAAMGRIRPEALAGCEFCGEFTLSGEIAALPDVAQTLAQRGRGRCVIPAANDEQARKLPAAQRPDAAHVALAGHLLEVYADLKQEAALPTLADPPEALLHVVPSVPLAELPVTYPAARALLATAAGGHAALFIGAQNSPVFGLVDCLPALLPLLDEKEMLALGFIKAHNGAHVTAGGRQRRPWIIPAEEMSATKFFGVRPYTGELARAMYGVCYLKYLPEYPEDLLNKLTGIVRTGMVPPELTGAQPYALPFQLVASMLSCACGYAGDASLVCECSVRRQEGYLARVPTQLMEHFDVRYMVRRLRGHEPADNRAQLASNAELAAQVARLRAAQLEQYKMLHAQLSDAAAKRACALKGDAKQALDAAHRRLQLTSADLGCVYRLALTLAALDGTPAITAAQVREAVALRRPQAQSDRG